MSDLSSRWQFLLDDILQHGREVSPRGQLTREIPQNTLEVSMRTPVLTVPERKIHYGFMAAEAYWILSGDDTVAGIERYNKHIAKFSDDGEVFFGAYGPKIIGQVQYVVNKLHRDPDTRQAGLTIWRENPPDTKDVPCTVSMFFNIRNGKLNCHTFMRSSDAWLGIPYDVFNFSMVSHYICGLLNMKGGNVQPGTLYLTAASAHLYERNFEDAARCVNADVAASVWTPDILYNSDVNLLEYLKNLRDTKPGRSPLRWWEPFDASQS